MKMNAPPEQEASPQGTSPESGESPALTKTQAARRRILGATLGAPVIYTLPSGALQAASSSLCEDNPDNFKLVTVDSDGDVRLTDTNDSTTICSLDEEDECLIADRTWVYDGSPTGDGDVQGTLYTQSCWTSMGINPTRTLDP